MRGKGKAFSGFLAGAIVAATLLMLFSSLAGQQDQPTWLEPAEPSRLEWAVLDLQANHRRNALAEEGWAVSFRTGPESQTRGVIYCDIAYVMATSSATVGEQEERIGRLFENRSRERYPWATLRFERHVVSPSMLLRPAAVSND